MKNTDEGKDGRRCGIIIWFRLDCVWIESDEYSYQAYNSTCALLRMVQSSSVWGMAKILSTMMSEPLRTTVPI